MNFFFSSVIQVPKPRKGTGLYSWWIFPQQVRQSRQSSPNMSTGQLDLNNPLLRFSSWMFLGCVKLTIIINFIPLVHSPPSPDLLPPPFSLTHAHSVSPLSIISLSCNIWVFAGGFVWYIQSKMERKCCFLSKSERKMCRVWNDNKNSCFASQSPCSEI